MKDSKPPIRDAAEQAVSEAWRALPQPEPPAGLDARVRAGVAAILEAENGGTAPGAKVLRFPAWRRVAAPTAIAATMVLAFGIGHLWKQDEGSQAPAPAPTVSDAPRVDAAPQAPVGRADVAEAAEPAAPAAKIEARAARARAETRREAVAQAERERRKEDADFRVVLAPLAEIGAEPKPEPASAPAAAAATALSPASPVVAAAPAPAPGQAVAKREADALQSDAAAKPAESPARMQSRSAAFAAAPPPPPARSVAENTPEPTLAAVRDALREGRRDDAKSALKRWREAHPQAGVPEDLRVLAGELDAETPAR